MSSTTTPDTFSYTANVGWVTLLSTADIKALFINVGSCYIDDAVFTIYRWPGTSNTITSGENAYIALKLGSRGRVGTAPIEYLTTIGSRETLPRETVRFTIEITAPNGGIHFRTITINNFQCSFFNGGP